MQWNLLTTRWSSVSSCYLYNTPKPVHRHITMHYSVWRVLWGGENNSFCVWELFSNCFFSSTALKVRMLQRLKITFIHFLRWRKKKKKQQEEKQWKTNLTKNPHQFRELKKKKSRKKLTFCLFSLCRQFQGEQFSLWWKWNSWILEGFIIGKPKGSRLSLVFPGPGEKPCVLLDRRNRGWEWSRPKGEEGTTRTTTSRLIALRTRRRYKRRV